jgi:F0F1-type ATP synthase membrane subunit b/b'
MKEGKKSDILGILFTLFVGIISISLTFVNPEMALIGMTALIAILFGIIAYWVTDYIVETAKKRLKQIDDNSQEIKNIKEEMKELYGKLDFHYEIAGIKAKIDMLEQKNDMRTKRRKGVIDPRIIIAIVIIILLFIYLRALGVL